MKHGEQWLSWASELQSLAQAGLYYGRDKFDLERYARIREIAAEMVAHQADLPLEQVKGWFCNETGYQTPKLATRAAVFQGERILLVKELILQQLNCLSALLQLAFCLHKKIFGNHEATDFMFLKSVKKTFLL